MNPAKRETNYMNSTTILVSYLDVICVSPCREVISSKPEDINRLRGQILEFWKTRTARICGAEIHSKELCKEICMESPEYVTNRKSHKHMVKLHKGRQKITPKSC